MGGAVNPLLERREDYAIGEAAPTRFDDEEWEW